MLCLHCTRDVNPTAPVTFDDLDVVNGEFTTPESTSPDSLQMLEDVFKGNTISLIHTRAMNSREISTYCVFSTFQIIGVNRMFKTITFCCCL